MNHFDQYLKKELSVSLYGRYVDDFVIVHPDKEYLKSLIPQLSNFLLSTLQLTMHPKKIYLQHYTKGIKFLGTIIKPNRIYIANRTKGNFYNAIQKHNKVVEIAKPTKSELNSFLSSMNSYLGIMKHYRTYSLRKKMIVKHLHFWWWNNVNITPEITKFVVNKRTTKA
jgi:RNA-directed DNA polymerase